MRIRKTRRETEIISGCATTPTRDRKLGLLRRCTLGFAALAAVACVLATVSCSSDTGDKEPTVTV
jgi:hypothetical protein